MALAGFVSPEAEPGSAVSCAEIPGGVTRPCQNVATGFQALQSNTTGIDNIATGTNALHANVHGHDNVANGFRAMLSNTSGSDNVAAGLNALYSNTSAVAGAIGFRLVSLPYRHKENRYQTWTRPPLRSTLAPGRQSQGGTMGRIRGCLQR